MTHIKVILILSLILFSFQAKAQFSEAQVLAPDLDNLRSVFLEDINQDGYLDLIIFQVTNTHYLLNDGNLNFDLWDILIPGEGLEQPFFCELADFDNDGDLDAAASSHKNDEIHMLFNTGSGLFANRVIISQDISRPLEIKAFDINNDNFNELFVTNFNPAGKRIVYLVNDGNNNFSSVDAGLPFYANPNRFDFFDIDSDSDEDIIVQWEAGRRLNWGENLDNSGDFGAFENIWVDSNFDGTPLAFHIQNKGNDIEVLFMSSKGSLYKVMGTPGNFSDPVQVFADEDNNFEEDLRRTVFGDVNNDGHVDIAYINVNNDELRFRFGEPTSSTNTELLGQMRIYPNPATEYLYIDHPNLSKYEILGIDGKILQRGTDRKVFLGAYVSGRYFARVYYDNGFINTYPFTIGK